jgi:hypothetical protein
MYHHRAYRLGSRLGASRSRTTCCWNASEIGVYRRSRAQDNRGDVYWKSCCARNYYTRCGGRQMLSRLGAIP